MNYPLHQCDAAGSVNHNSLSPYWSHCGQTGRTVWQQKFCFFYFDNSGLVWKNFFRRKGAGDFLWCSVCVLLENFSTPQCKSKTRVRRLFSFECVAHTIESPRKNSKREWILRKSQEKIFFNLKDTWKTFLLVGCCPMERSMRHWI